MAGALIGALRVSLSAETSAFEAGMKRSQRQAATSASAIQRSLSSVKGFGTGLLAGLSVGALVAATKSALEYAGSLAETAQQLGVTARDLQIFRFAAGQVGVSQDQLEVGLSKLTITLGKVAAGAKEPAKALAAIGISVDQVKGKSGGEAFRIIADGLQKVTDRAQRAAIEVALFGKTGSKLDNLLAGGSEAINNLEQAAQKLGIVLSDDQIQRADETADKLRAVKTVLEANIAGIVADNADSILSLANSLERLAVGVADFIASDPQRAIDLIAGLVGFRFGGPAGAGLAASGAEAAGLIPKIIQDLNLGGGGGSSSVTVALPPATRSQSGSNIPKFLAGGGGGHKRAREDHSAEQALRAQYDFDQQIRRANIDVLQAQQNIAENYIERTSIGIQILNAEQHAFAAELQYKVALGRLTKGKEGLSEAQAGQLKAAYDLKDAAERQGLLEDERLQRLSDTNELEQHDFDRRKDVLQAQEDLAETAAERRRIELQLLDIAYQQRKQALEFVIATSKDIAAVEDARRDLLNLNKTYSLDRAGVMQRTRGPLEDYLASLPTTAAKANEALQRLEVEGMDGLLDSVLALSEGIGKATDSLLETLKQFFLGLARLQLQRLLGSQLQGGGLNILGSLGGLLGFGTSGGGGSLAAVKLGDANLGFAGGGSFSVLGRLGTDKNLLSINGLPIANVSYGERISIANDNSRSWQHGRMAGVTMNVYTPDADSFRRSEGQVVRGLKRKLR